MPYRLREGLSFCEVDGRLIFLDVRNDRYFKLTEALERAVISCLAGTVSLDIDVRQLVDRKIVIEMPETPSGDAHLPSPAIAAPTHSAIEGAIRFGRVRAPVLLEVGAIVVMMRFQLAARRLTDILDKAAAYRWRRTTGNACVAANAAESDLVDAAVEFGRARPWAPIERCCLLDSLALAVFLARRRLPGAIVFGVVSDPFSAHCWVQAGDLVLNDTVGNVGAHTPIRVV